LRPSWRQAWAKEFGAVGGAAVGEEALDFDAMCGVEGEGLVECGEDAGGLFVGAETSKGESGVVVDGDVEALDAGAWIAVGAVAGGADARFVEAAEFLDVEVEEVARSVAFVADDGRLGRFEGAETMEAVTAQDAGESGAVDFEDEADLGV
jgi:hypothetical protein